MTGTGHLISDGLLATAVLYSPGMRDSQQFSPVLVVAHTHRADAEISRRKFLMKLYRVNVVLENREERKVVEPSLFRTMLRALNLCWTYRHSLAGVSLAGGIRPVAFHSVPEEENPMPKPTEGEMLLPGWLAEPITDEFWFPAEGE